MSNRSCRCKIEPPDIKLRVEVADINFAYLLAITWIEFVKEIDERKIGNDTVTSCISLCVTSILTLGRLTHTTRGMVQADLAQQVQQVQQLLPRFLVLLFA